MNTFKDLSRAVQDLYKSHKSLPYLGSSFLHIRHAIPQEQLNLLRDKTNKKPSTFLFCKKAIICFLAAGYESLMLFVLKIIFAPQLIAAFKKKPDVVIKTWVSGAQTLHSDTDFYYGDSVRRFSEKDKQVLYIWGDGRPDMGKFISKLRRPFDLIRMGFVGAYVPEKLLIPVMAPLGCFFKQFFSSLKLRRQTLDNKVEQALVLDLLRPQTLYNNLHYHMAKTVIKEWHPEAVITPYEGQPWEKTFWRGVRDSGVPTKIIGYQHTIVMSYADGLREPSEVPDLVLCTGPVTESMLKPAHEKKGSRTQPFGTFRRKESDATLHAPDPKRKTVLVLPEGILSEAVRIFNHALELAKKQPDYHFIFRCHPIQPFRLVAPHLKYDVNEFKNVEVSEVKTLQDDFKRSSLLFYRGSSTVLYAILNGLKPVYLADDGMNVDPLFELDCWREKSDSLEKSLEIVSQFESNWSGKEEWEKASRYVDQYIRPVTEQSFNELVRSLDEPQ